MKEIVQLDPLGPDNLQLTDFAFGNMILPNGSGTIALHGGVVGGPSGLL